MIRVIRDFRVIRAIRVDQKCIVKRYQEGIRVIGASAGERVTSARRVTVRATGLTDQGSRGSRITSRARHGVNGVIGGGAGA